MEYTAPLADSDNFQFTTSLKKPTASEKLGELSRAAAGSKITEGFDFIEQKELMGLDYAAITQLVNKKFAEKFKRLPPLYSTETIEGNVLWSESLRPHSRFKLSMYHVEEIKPLEPVIEKVSRDDLKKAQEIIRRAVEFGVEA